MIAATKLRIYMFFCRGKGKNNQITSEFIIIAQNLLAAKEFAYAAFGEKCNCKIRCIGKTLKSSPIPAGIQTWD